ncbi:MAG: S41 family peptidase [Candidatus Moranbacteria bacterium]|nr:S41 family peptidase [Candidatus Moranbacteria bacterium]
MQEINTENNISEEFRRYKKRMLRYYFQILLVIILGGGMFWIGYEKGKQCQPQTISPISIDGVVFKNKDQGNNTNIDFSLFWSVWDLLKSKYVDSGKLDARKLYYGAIKGMMQATGDPYTTFFDPEENKKFGEDISGNFEGIGAELGIKGGILTVVAPLQGTPAEKAGLRSGDKIIKIDGKSAGDMTIEEAVNNIRGPKGTSVVLTIFRDGSQDTQDITVNREVINVKSVTLEFKDNNIADIKITRFGDDTTKGFNDAINKAVAQKSKGLIIDLRNNPGGYLESAIDIASKLLPKNQVVVIEESGDKSQKKMYSRGGDVASSLQTVVLINEGSASASEILAGALKDDRADNVTLVGKKSFGKGSVQEFIEMPQGTAAKITVARWLTPDGTQINEQGIKPDQEVDLTNDDYANNKDPQFDAAMQTLKDKLSSQTK